jgi:hypothetical protein
VVTARNPMTLAAAPDDCADQWQGGAKGVTRAPCEAKKGLEGKGATVTTCPFLSGRGGVG